jgi:Mg2+/Co2+ transporter CorB
MHGLGGAGGAQFQWTDVLIVFLCVLLSAFFSGSETALTAAQGP